MPSAWSSIVGISALCSATFKLMRLSRLAANRPTQGLLVRRSVRYIYPVRPQFPCRRRLPNYAAPPRHPDDFISDCRAHSRSPVAARPRPMSSPARSRRTDMERPRRMRALSTIRRKHGKRRRRDQGDPSNAIEGRPYAIGSARWPCRRVRAQCRRLRPCGIWRPRQSGMSRGKPPRPRQTQTADDSLYDLARRAGGDGRARRARMPIARC